MLSLHSLTWGLLSPIFIVDQVCISHCAALSMCLNDNETCIVCTHTSLAGT